MGAFREFMVFAFFVAVHGFFWGGVVGFIGFEAFVGLMV